jgi:hypothetical protein
LVGPVFAVEVPVAGSCELDNEASSSYDEERESPEQMGNYQFLNNTVPLLLLLLLLLLFYRVQPSHTGHTPSYP